MTIFRSSTDIELAFLRKISKALFDCVLCYCDTIALKTPKSREKNDGRRYFDDCEITTTEYKWTTNLFKNHKTRLWTPASTHQI